MNVLVLLEFGRAEKSLLALLTFPRSVRGIGVDLLVDFEASFCFVELQALVTLEVS